MTTITNHLGKPAQVPRKDIWGRGRCDHVLWAVFFGATLGPVGAGLYLRRWFDLFALAGVCFAAVALGAGGTTCMLLGALWTSARYVYQKHAGGDKAGTAASVGNDQ